MARAIVSANNSAALLIRQKLNGQATLVRDMLRISLVADAIEKFREELSQAESIDALRVIESQAARTYWSAWSSFFRWDRAELSRALAQLSTSSASWLELEY